MGPVIEDAVRTVAETITTPVEPEHMTLFGWLLEHIRDEGGVFVGGFVAYCLHTMYHRLWHRPGHALIRLIFRRKK